MNKTLRTIISFLCLFIVLSMVGQFFSSSLSGQDVPFSTFLEQVDAGEVQSVSVEGYNISGTYQDGARFTSYMPPHYNNLVDRLEAKQVEITAREPQASGWDTLFGVLISWFPMLLLIGVWIFFMRQMQGGKGGGAGGGGPFGFGKSKARMLTEENNKIRFNDVAGVEEAKEELEEVVDFLKDPSKFQKLGGKIPKGCLLVGPPGTGKTLLAKAIAGEAGVPFFTISGSDFVEMFVGVGASRVRDMFEQARKHAPCIIFVDEIDAVGRHRGAGYGGGNDEREQTLNQILVEMDGFESSEGVIVLAATNRADVLDQALLRPGRFDRQITVPNPDIDGREKILGIHTRKVPLSPDVDIRVIARGTPGFSGADLANLVNEAALLAARRSKKIVTMQELEDAKDKVMMGVERRSMVMSDEEKELTAYHEAGHAIVGLNCPASDPIHKATIIPRGQALGMVMRLPERDRISVTREKLHADLAVAMGGRVAEEMIFGYDKVTSGASSDIHMATNLATKMVTEWGMSDKIGPLYHGENEQGMYQGMAYGGGASRAEVTSEVIDAEVKRMVEEAYQRAEKILTDQNKDLHKLAKALLRYETLTGDEITDVLKGKKVRVHEDAEDGDAVAESMLPKVSAKKKTARKTSSTSKAKKPRSTPASKAKKDE